MGGLTGYGTSVDIDKFLKKAQEVIVASKDVNPDVICLVHGGPFYDPESARVIYSKTDAQGFIAASAIERIPVEKAVIATCKDFKNLPVTRNTK